MLNSKTIQYPFDKTDLVHMQDLVSGPNVIYEGWAAPGTAASAAAWQICKHTYDGNNNRLSTTFAGGTNDYNQVWDISSYPLFFLHRVPPSSINLIYLRERH